MTLIWRCDNCGQQTECDTIVGNEFGYLKHGYGSLARTVAGKRDLCSRCMMVAQTASGENLRHHERRARAAADAAVAEALRSADHVARAVSAHDDILAALQDLVEVYSDANIEQAREVIARTTAAESAP